MAHDNWQTPPDLWEALRAEFDFTLDAAANAENALLNNFITEEQDALVTPWHASGVFCNPPYSRLHDFTLRAAEQQYDLNNTVVLLIPAYTDTRWWNNYVAHCAEEIRFLVGRVRFWENGAPGKDSARFPSAVVVYRPKPVGNITRHVQHTYWNWRVRA